MSLTPQKAESVLREKFRSMTKEEFVRIASRVSPSLLEESLQGDSTPGPRILSHTSANPMDSAALRDVLFAMGITCKDEEIEPILAILAGKGVNTVGGLIAMANGGKSAALYDLFLEHRAENARAFDFVACLADASDAATLDAFRARSLTLLSILDEFDRLRSA